MMCPQGLSPVDMLEFGETAEPSVDMDRSCHFSSCNRGLRISLSLAAPPPCSWERSCQRVGGRDDGGKEGRAQSVEGTCSSRSFSRIFRSNASRVSVLAELPSDESTESDDILPPGDF